MFSLAISFGPQGQIWSFLFKEKQTAWENYSGAMAAMVGGDSFRIVDDFEQGAFFRAGETSGALVQDLDQMIESRIQHSLNDAKAQARYNARIKTDPEIRALQNGPAVLTPGFRN
jgi:hypothetical protein